MKVLTCCGLLLISNPASHKPFDNILINEFRSSLIIAAVEGTFSSQVIISI